MAGFRESERMAMGNSGLIDKELDFERKKVLGIAGNSRSTII